MRIMIAFGHKLLLCIIMAICFILVQDFVAQNARADQEPAVTIDQIMAHLAFDKSK